MLSFNRICRSFAPFCLVALAQPAAWAESFFAADKPCEAYVSTKKLNNPGAIKLEVGKSYPVLATDRPDNPEWFQVRVEAANPLARWVKEACGKTGDASGGGGTAASGDICHVAGNADSYVFALSWQSAFCESKPDKPECQISDPKVYQATHFTLHGLWPNKNGCGINYDYCGSVKAKPSGSFCDYPDVALAAQTRKDLTVVMPGVASCLERHEWHKHGTCQKETPDRYFELAASLVRQFNDSGVAQFMTRRLGQRVGPNDFRAVLNAGLGAGADRHVKLGCKDGLLVDVQLSLPADVRPNADLKALLAKGPAAPADNSCKNGFRVDAIGQ